MISDPFLRQIELVEAQQRLDRIRRCVEGQREWVARYAHHPQGELARELLASMEASLIESERLVDQLCLTHQARRNTA